MSKIIYRAFRSGQALTIDELEKDYKRIKKAFLKASILFVVSFFVIIGGTLLAFLLVMGTNYIKENLPIPIFVGFFLFGIYLFFTYPVYQAIDPHIFATEVKEIEGEDFLTLRSILYKDEFLRNYYKSVKEQGRELTEYEMYCMTLWSKQKIREILRAKQELAKI